MYLCGMTVDAAPHIGHLRGGLNFDVLLRWLQHSGYQVTYVRNVTDIDDKILRRAAEAGEQWWARAARVERTLVDSYRLLGCLPPTIEPRATGHIPEMIAMMGRLIAAGHAYAADGDVYFDVASWPSYGELSGQQVDAMQQGETAATGKRSAVDFTLWKGTKPGEPVTASWASPWGPGRPGWHLECSAMAGKYLGPAFDIHGGGIDLVFPHHENEIAQSRADGQSFSAFWLHNAWVTLAGEKMSKSLGNVLSVETVTKIARPVELRYYLSTPHYRSTIAYSEEALAEAVTAYRRIEDFVVRATETVGEIGGGELPADFVAAMNDDLGVPRAVAVLHDAVRDGNTALAGNDRAAVRAALGNVRAMLGILGLDPFDPQWTAGGGSDRTADRLREVVDALVKGVLAARQDARNRKDFATADALRDHLKAAGVLVEDSSAGSRWTLEH
jgi:cysteinyl-tRNA synthetase